MAIQNLNLGMLDKILGRISTPEGLEATAQQLANVAPPNVSDLGQQAGSMQSLEQLLQQRIDPMAAPQIPGFSAQTLGGLGQALTQQAQPQQAVPVAPVQVPPAQVPGQFILKAPAQTPTPRLGLAQALRGY